MIDLGTGLEEKTKERPKKEKKSKQLLIRQAPPMAMYEIYYEGGGEVPTTLTGLYTSQLMAQKDIDMYLANKKR